MIREVWAPLRIDLAGGWTDVPNYADKHGGAVVNIAISRFVSAILHEDDKSKSIGYAQDVPKGSGLGTSAAMNLATVALLEQDADIDWDKRLAMAERAYNVECALGVTGGRQDQYASACGGINFMQFSKSGVHVQPLELNADFLTELAERLILVYTGESHNSSGIHDDIWDRYKRSQQYMQSQLDELRESAYRIRKALLASDIDEVGQEMIQAFIVQGEMSDSIVTDHAKLITTAAWNAGADGWKTCGAGGGGCVLILSYKDRQEAVKNAVTEAGGTVLPFGFDFNGLRIKESN
jgi:D-glycero-alpha-D-manno-heptose-7-phosphate kinase